LSYNVLLTTPEVNIVAKHIVPIVTTKSLLTYTNCGKIGHTLETCHNRKIEVTILPTTTVKSIKLIAKTKTQPTKSIRIPI
jgi:hypothetical protein